MIKNIPQNEIDPQSLQIANDIRPILESHMNTQFYKYSPSVYHDNLHNPQNNVFSFSIIIDLNKTLYVTVLKNPDNSNEKYQILKYLLLP